jgi:carbon monoxide dehydrogenase subunit G
MRSACSVSASRNLLAAILTLQIAFAAAADDVSVAVDRNGRGFAVQATATIDAPVAVVWEVLTDYDHLARFIPGLWVSSVHLRSGNRVQLEQKGEARFLVFSYPIEVVLEVFESPRSSISSRAVGGNLRRMSGRYDVKNSGSGISLRYTGELEPDFELPPIIGTLAVRSMVKEQFGAMVAEIERRAAAPK